MRTDMERGLTQRLTNYLPRWKEGRPSLSEADSRFVYEYTGASIVSSLLDGVEITVCSTCIEWWEREFC